MTLETGLHFNVSETIYHADPCPAPSASASILRLMLDASPAHAWHAHPRLNPAHEQSEPTGDMEIGTAAHALILEQRDVIELCDFDDWRTKDARAARAAARLAGRVPLLIKDHARIEQMADAVRRTLSQRHEAFDWLDDADTEATAIWQEGGRWCRSRIDVLPRQDGMPIYDLKTTRGSAHPAVWSRRLFEEGKDVQAAFYRAGLRTLGRAPGPFRFVVVEMEPPFGVSVIQMEPEAVAFAERRMEAAWRLWCRCLDGDVWPGFAPFVHHVEAPVFAKLRHEQHEAAEKMAHEMTGAGHLERALAAGVDPRI